MVICLLVLGGVVGFAAGLLGIGGGMLLVPFLTMLFAWQGMPADLVVHAAIATSMTSILFTSISSVRPSTTRHDQVEHRLGDGARHHHRRPVLRRRRVRRAQHAVAVAVLRPVRRLFRLEHAAQQEAQAQPPDARRGGHQRGRGRHRLPVRPGGRGGRFPVGAVHGLVQRGPAQRRLHVGGAGFPTRWPTAWATSCRA